MSGLLEPGAHRADGLVDDHALLGAMRTVEIAWLRALATTGVLDPADAERVAERVATADLDADTLARDAEGAGNPVVPLVKALRAAVGDDALAGLLHRGLTSQDVLDTALVLVARQALGRVGTELRAAA
ncbi:PcaB, partial [Saccharomonospora azurea SZMC 14600]